MFLIHFQIKKLLKTNTITMSSHFQDPLKKWITCPLFIV